MSLPASPGTTAPGSDGPAAARRPPVLAAVALFTLLTAAMTWPQVRHLDEGIADIGDPLLNTWALAWVAHQFPYAPARLFDGNIFHPERRTLAYSETLLAPAAIGAPLLWLGAAPVAVYNLLMFASFVASGAGVALLVHGLTGRRGAAVVAGAVFAFLPFRFDHYSHFQLLQTQWMPLALWGLHRTVDRARLRDGALLGLAVGLQVMTSVYNALFLGLFLAAVGGVLLVWRGLSLARVRAVAVAAVVAGTLAAPVGLAHMGASRIVGERARAEVVTGGAHVTDYLASRPGTLLHDGWNGGFGGPERRLYPGAVAVALTIVALWPPLSGVRVAYAVGLIVAFELSRGLNGPIYTWLYDHVFLFRSLRVPARMGLLVGLGLAVLAGFGVARLQSRLRPRTGGLLAALLLGAVLADTWVAPLGLTMVPNDVPETYADLMRHRGLSTDVPVARRRGDPAPTVLLELPLSTEVPTYMLYATYHWQTLVNGYSGFFSERYLRMGQVLQQFPDAASVSVMQSLGVRYVTVHGEFMRAGEYQALVEKLDRLAPVFRLVSKRPWKDREISLYAFTPPAGP
jgi:hypothetical protein